MRAPSERLWLARALVARAHWARVARTPAYNKHPCAPRATRARTRIFPRRPPPVVEPPRAPSPRLAVIRPFRTHRARAYCHINANISPALPRYCLTSPPPPLCPQNSSSRTAQRRVPNAPKMRPQCSSQPRHTSRPHPPLQPTHAPHSSLPPPPRDVRMSLTPGRSLLLAHPPLEPSSRSQHASPSSAPSASDDDPARTAARKKAMLCALTKPSVHRGYVVCRLCSTLVWGPNGTLPLLQARSPLPMLATDPPSLPPPPPHTGTQGDIISKSAPCCVARGRRPTRKASSWCRCAAFASTRHCSRRPSRRDRRRPSCPDSSYRAR